MLIEYKSLLACTAYNSLKLNKLLSSFIKNRIYLKFELNVMFAYFRQKKNLLNSI